MRYEGDQAGNTGSPRDVLKGAYRCFDFIDEDIWLAMLHDRNLVEHAYDAAEVDRVLADVMSRYIPEFMSLRDAIEVRYADVLAEMP